MAEKVFYDAEGAVVVNLRCPFCHKNGVFSGLRNVNDAKFHVPVSRNPQGKVITVTEEIYGVRICPNLDCGAPVFITKQIFKNPVTYPAERLEFDATQIPKKIVASFEEAITSHSNRCYRAAAIMIRRTLEEVCADQGADGADLSKRIASLSKKIMVPNELLLAANELRLLGNDAAHLEAKVYDDIGEDEVGAAIELAKEILKAVYQLSSLVDRLRKLKKS